MTKSQLIKHGFKPISKSELRKLDPNGKLYVYYCWNREYWFTLSQGHYTGESAYQFIKSKEESLFCKITNILYKVN